MFKRFWTHSLQFVLATFFLPLGANVCLDHLEQYDQETCLEMLEAIELADLWSHFLSGQTNLFFDQEAGLITSESFWQEAKSILEIGSGNGAYLHKLSGRFEDKQYVGIEKQAKLVEQSTQQFGQVGLEFREGDAECEYEDYFHLFDVVLFRLTLQHLKNPRLALEHAYKYLKEGGHIIIIDSYDAAKSSSHPLPSFAEASRQHNEQNKKEMKGNRQITMEILKELQNGSEPLNECYEVARTNLDEQGTPIGKRIKFESEQERKLYFNQILLFLDILHKERNIPVDFRKAHEELQVYLEDDQAWICPGIHYLVLRKKLIP